MRKFLLYLWEFPQNLIGLCLSPLYKVHKEVIVEDRKVRICKNFPGGISLGSYIFSMSETNDFVMHEFGHSKQSKYLGPLYLFVIGIPSIIWAALYDNVIPYSPNGYYKFYTEKWADKLGGITR